MPAGHKTNYHQQIDDYLVDVISHQISRSNKIHVRYSRLWQELLRITRAGGKRLRPQLLIYSYRGLGGNDLGPIMPIAAALELLHLSMLVHDDVIDRDTVRHGVDNITGSYEKLYSHITNASDRRHYAESAALLAGDSLLASAYRLIGMTALDSDTKSIAFELFDEAVFQVIGGELLDTESSIHPIGEISSDTVMNAKTSSYSFIMPMLLGARLAGAPNDTLSELRTLGEHLGIAFQLRDDYIGIFGDESISGKSTTGDLREGKRTKIIELFYQAADKDTLTAFNQLFGRGDLTKSQAETLRGLLYKAAIQDKVKQLIDDHIHSAKQIISSVSFTPETAEFFDNLLLVIASRDR